MNNEGGVKNLTYTFMTLLPPVPTPLKMLAGIESRLGQLDRLLRAKSGEKKKKTKKKSINVRFSDVNMSMVPNRPAVLVCK